jgi:hypothetical protein
VTTPSTQVDKTHLQHWNSSIPHTQMRPALGALEALGSAVEDHLHLLLPALMRLVSPAQSSTPVEMRRAVLKCARHGGALGGAGWAGGRLAGGGLGWRGVRAAAASSSVINAGRGAASRVCGEEDTFIPGLRHW